MQAKNMIDKETLMEQGGVRWIRATVNVDNSWHGREALSASALRDYYSEELSIQIGRELVESGVVEIEETKGMKIPNRRVDEFEARVLVVTNPGWLLTFFSNVALALSRLKQLEMKNLSWIDFQMTKDLIEDAIRK